MSGIEGRLREELGALLDGELAPERAAELRARLDSDDALRREYDELARAVAALRSMPAERAPASLRDGVWTRIEQTDGDVSAAPLARRFTLPGASWLAAAGVLLGAGILAWWLGRDAAPDTGSGTGGTGEYAKTDRDSVTVRKGFERSENREDRLGDKDRTGLAEKLVKEPSPARTRQERTRAPLKKGGERARKRDGRSGNKEEAYEKKADKPAAEARSAGAKEKVAGPGGGDDAASGRRVGTRPGGKRKSTVLPVIMRAEQSKKIEPKNLRAYLQAVRSLSVDRLRKHLRVVAGLEENAVSVAPGSTPGVTLEKREDIMAVREILWRSYVPATKAIRPIVVTGERRHLELTLQLAALDRAAATGWLNRLPASRPVSGGAKKRAGKPRAAPRERRRAEAKAGEQKRRVVFRLAWVR